MARHAEQVAALARPLTGPGDLDPLLDRIGGARVVLLGEASHGTREFYTWRSAITRRLIEERGFSFVAVEGDWPDCARVDAAVRGLPGAPGDPREALVEFARWPTWMWANEEVSDFSRWLRGHNEGLEPGSRVGFHGLDVYSLWESLREIMTYLREHDPDQLAGALAAYRCFEPYAEDPQAYAWAHHFVAASCEREVVDLLARTRRRAAASDDFAIAQNAAVVAGAEHYYRALVRGGPHSWNVRDRHMDDTLARLMEHYGSGAKAVVWAHNTHVGDSRGTDQSAAGEVTIGELARERFGADAVALVGMGSHHGTVVAAGAWGAPMQVLAVPPARPEALEDLLHQLAPPRALMVFPGEPEPELLAGTFAHRAIGVVYQPERERWSNYVPTVPGKRYDAFCWFDETHAVLPLHTSHVDVHELETFPSGV